MVGFRLLWGRRQILSSPRSNRDNTKDNFYLDLMFTYESVLPKRTEFTNPRPNPSLSKNAYPLMYIEDPALTPPACRDTCLNVKIGKNYDINY